MNFEKGHLFENEAKYVNNKNKRILTENESEISFDLLFQTASNFQHFVLMMREAKLWNQTIHKVSFPDINI